MTEQAFQEWLAAATGKPIQLVVTENRSLLLSLKHKSDGRVIVRAHRMFLDAPREVQEAMAAWVGGRRGQTRRIIRRFIHSQRPPRQLALSLFGAKPRRLTLHSRGNVYDLVELRDEINRGYFDGKLNCAITWGRRMRSRARRHFTFGTYSHTQNVVRIHPRLDSAEVPRFFVGFIVYHEMLHAERGQEGERNGRRIVHSKEFRADERRFAQYPEATEWEKNNLGRFLRATWA